MKKTDALRLLCAVCFSLILSTTVTAQDGLPPLPPDASLDSYSFLTTNWLSDDGLPLWKGRIAPGPDLAVLGNQILALLELQFIANLKLPASTVDRVVARAKRFRTIAP